METQTLIISIVFFVLIVLFFILEGFLDSPKAMLIIRRVFSIILIAYLFYDAVDAESKRHLYFAFFLSFLVISQFFLKGKRV